MTRTKNILCTSGSDNNLSAQWSDAHFNARVSVSSQLSGKELVQLSVEHSVSYELHHILKLWDTVTQICTDFMHLTQLKAASQWPAMFLLQSAIKLGCKTRILVHNIIWYISVAIHWWLLHPSSATTKEPPHFLAPSALGRTFLFLLICVAMIMDLNIWQMYYRYILWEIWCTVVDAWVL